MTAAVHPSDVPPADPTREPVRPGDRIVVRCEALDGSVARRELRVDAFLGKGGMATVWAATDLGRDAARVAVKVLSPELAADPRARARFLREKALAERVHHPAAVPIELAGTIEGADHPALVMELVDGENLEVVRRRLGGKLPRVPALRVAEETLDYLVACHAAGIVHRDVKTANLIWAPSRPLRIVDFGIARCAALASPEADAGDPTVGTPAFMSPEQAAGLGEDVDARADVFSVGAVLFTLLSGKRLHRGRTHDESLFLAATQAAPSLADVDDAIPSEIVAIVDRALAFARDDRFPDAAAMRDAVRAVREREEARLSVPPSRDGLDDDAHGGDGLAEPPPYLSSGSLPVAARPPDARGTFSDTPLPHLLVHVLARALDGTLVVQHSGPNGEAREVVEFAAGAPIRRGASATDDPIVGPLARIAQLPPEATYRFYIEDRPHEPGALLPWTRLEPLDAILTSTRRLCKVPSFAARVRATLDRLGDRPIRLHPAAAPARFGLSALERAALDAAREHELSYPQLLAAAVAPAEIVDPLLYALGITRHLDVGAEGVWPLGVPRSG